MWCRIPENDFVYHINPFGLQCNIYVAVICSAGWSGKGWKISKDKFPTVSLLRPFCQCNVGNIRKQCIFPTKHHIFHFATATKREKYPTDLKLRNTHEHSIRFQKAFYRTLWSWSRILESSQEKRLKLNKGLWEKVTVADADQKVVPTTYKKYHNLWFLVQTEDEQQTKSLDNERKVA